MWDHVADLSELGDWLVMHEGWRSELPDEISEGTQIIGVARSKGLRRPVVCHADVTLDDRRRADATLGGAGAAPARRASRLA